MDSHFQQSTHNRQSGQGESRVRAIICVIWLDDIFIFVVLCLRICLPFQSIVRHLSKTTINCHCCVVCTPENYLCVLPNLLDRENILAILFIHFSHLRLVNFFLFFFAIAVSALYRFCEWSRQVHGPVIFLFSFAFFFCCMFSFLGGRFAVVAFCILLTGGECKDYKKKRKEKNVVQCSERFWAALHIRMCVWLCGWLYKTKETFFRMTGSGNELCWWCFPHIYVSMCVCVSILNNRMDVYIYSCSCTRQATLNICTRTCITFTFAYVVVCLSIL